MERQSKEATEAQEPGLLRRPFLVCGLVGGVCGFLMMGLAESHRTLRLHGRLFLRDPEDMDFYQVLYQAACGLAFYGLAFYSVGAKAEARRRIETPFHRPRSDWPWPAASRWMLASSSWSLFKPWVPRY